MDFPAEIQSKVAEFDDILSKLETSLQPLFNTQLAEIHSKLSPLEAAKVDLIAAYSLNSLLWIYLNTRGENPKEHGIKQELDRIRHYMTRAKEIQTREKDKAQAPKVNVPVAQRFVKSALWKAAHSTAKPADADTGEAGESDKAVKAHKRPIEISSTKHKVKKKKK